MTETIDRKLKIYQRNDQRNQADIVHQGEAYPFAFEVNGDGASSFTGTASVMQYPRETPALTPAVTYADEKLKGTLTSAETAALAIGQWFIYVKASDSDEDLRAPIKFYVAKGWT